MTTKFGVVVGFVVALIYLEMNGDTWTNAAPQLDQCLTIRNIVNFQMSVIMLLEDAKSVDKFEEYFDPALRREMQYILNRLRGFASDAAQADEWQHAAWQFFRFYFVNVCVTQAKEYAEAYSSYVKPCSLTERCARPAADRMTEMFKAKFPAPPLANPTLLYEVLRFTNLPLIVVLTPSTAPFLRVLLKAGTCASYVEMAGGGLQTNFKPKEFAPHENIITDIRQLNHALTALSYRSTREFFHANPRLAEQDGELHKFLRTTLQSLTEQEPQSARPDFEKIGEHIIDNLERELLTHFLSNEYFWLACHPAYPHEETKDEADLIRLNRALHVSLMGNMVRARCRLIQTHFNLATLLSARLDECMESGGYALRRVYESPSTLTSSTSPSAATLKPSMQAPDSR